MILVAGEALIDLFAGAPAGGALPLKGVAGGSPFNVAVGLARLGVETSYLGGLSADALGDFLADRLAAEGVGLLVARRSARPTPVVVVSTAVDGQPRYAFYAQDCAHADIAPSDLPHAGPAPAALALGSFALTAEPAASVLLALAEREGAGTVVSIDLNLRPSMVGPLPAWRERIARLARTAAIVKASEEDLADGYSGAEAGSLAAAWLDGGAALVIVTAGAAGATAYHRGGSLHRPGRSVPVADTVGAGDTFHAALLARLAETGQLHRAALAGLDAGRLTDLLDYAIAAAGITCTRRGADLPRRAEVAAALATPRPA